MLVWLYILIALEVAIILALLLLINKSKRLDKEQLYRLFFMAKASDLRERRKQFAKVQQQLKILEKQIYISAGAAVIGLTILLVVFQPANLYLVLMLVLILLSPLVMRLMREWSTGVIERMDEITLGGSREGDEKGRG